MVLFQAIQDAKTVEDIKRVAAELEQFSVCHQTSSYPLAKTALRNRQQENPVDIPIDLSKQFLLLRRDMREFESKIDDFVQRKGFKASEVAAKLMKEISFLQSDIDRQVTSLNAVVGGTHVHRRFSDKVRLRSTLCRYDPCELSDLFLQIKNFMLLLGLSSWIGVCSISSLSKRNMINTPLFPDDCECVSWHRSLCAPHVPEPRFQ